MSVGPVMLDLEGPALSAEERELLAHPLVGGVILFTRNYVDRGQLAELVATIHAVRSPRLLVAVDHEGGRVQRFREGFTRLPPLANLGALYRREPARAEAAAHSLGWLMAAELRAAELDFSFAPVLDVDQGVSGVIGDRAFAAAPADIAELACAYVNGMAEAGMAATGKHFPGHGGVAGDSHTELPVDGREYNEIRAHDLLPFSRLIRHGLAAVMPAHVVYERVDALPAGFSEFWLREVLRRRLHFQGVIFSDDLNMAGAGAVGEDYAERARRAMAAGCDMVLVCNNRAGAIRVLEGIGEHSDPVSQMRLARMHGRHQLSFEGLRADPRWREAVGLASELQADPDLAFDFEDGS